MVLATQIPEQYPDLIEQGGLTNAVQSALRFIGSSLSVMKPADFMNSAVYSRVELNLRFSQIYIGSQVRMFGFDFWNNGVCLAHGSTPDLFEMANCIDKWLSSSCTTSELTRDFHFVIVEPKAKAFELGTEVESCWQKYLTSLIESEPDLVPFVFAAAQETKLRQLFPFMSLMSFCFSRCTGFPYSGDIASVLATAPNDFQVTSCSGEIIGRGNAEEAVAMVVAALPWNCGPAVPGTVEQLKATGDDHLQK